MARGFLLSGRRIGRGSLKNELDLTHHGDRVSFSWTVGFYSAFTRVATVR